MRHFLVFSQPPYLEMRRNRKQHALVLLLTTPIFIFNAFVPYLCDHLYLSSTSMGLSTLLGLFSPPSAVFPKKRRRFSKNLERFFQKSRAFFPEPLRLFKLSRIISLEEGKKPHFAEQ